MRRFSVFFFVFCFVFGWIAAGRGEDVFISKEYAFRIPLPAGGFERIKDNGTAIALMNKETGSSFAVSVSDDPYISESEKELSLFYLARGLFIYVDKKEFTISEPAEVGGLPGWYIEAKGEVDSVPLAFAAFVVRFNKRIYDIVFWAPPDAFEADKKIFLLAVSGFSFTENARP